MTKKRATIHNSRHADVSDSPLFNGKAVDNRKWQECPLGYPKSSYPKGHPGEHFPVCQGKRVGEKCGMVDIPAWLPSDCPSFVVTWSCDGDCLNSGKLPDGFKPPLIRVGWIGDDCPSELWLEICERTAREILRDGKSS